MLTWSNHGPSKIYLINSQQNKTTHPLTESSSFSTYRHDVTFYPQVSTCNPPCNFYGLTAACSSMNLHWVPGLPPNITHLFLEFNYISEINSTSLRDYDQLLDIDLGWQYVPLIIRNNAFLRQRNLKRLVLGQKAGLQLEPRAFAGLFNLQWLFLDSSNLTDSILSDGYMEPLLSLEVLDLSFNKIVRLRPAHFFSQLRRFNVLKLKLNKIKILCEEDLVGFKGKHFALLDLHSNTLGQMFEEDFDKESCGNPFHGIAFDVLNIRSNAFSTITLEQFLKNIKGTQISHLKVSHFGKGFSHDNLPDPDENTFEGLVNSSVTNLDLSGNNIFALQRNVFSFLKAAIIIDISRNKVNQIDSNAFSGLQGNLRMLNLSFNLLGEVHNHMFNNLTDLRVLDLSHNHIGILGYQAFSGLSNLRGLFLTGNSLRKLDFPAPLPKLELLLLGDNKLEWISGVEFAISSHYVDISNNRLRNLDNVYEIVTKFESLQIFYFGGNFIKWCILSPVPYNNSLQVLDLHDSSLQALWAQGKCHDLFDHFGSLEGLNISYNSIATLPHSIFRGLRSIREIDLSFNDLTYLQPDVFPDSLKILHISNNFLASPDPQSFSSLVALDLGENRFYCDCNLEMFLSWQNVTDVMWLSPVNELRCAFPPDLYNRPLSYYRSIMKPCVDEEMAAQHLAFALFVFSAVLIITFILSGVAYIRFRGRIFVVYKRIIGRVLEGPKPSSPMKEGKYDAFFCFNNNDYRWVEAALLKKLDNQFSEKNILRCCFESRDFLPGEDHLSNIRDAIWSSRKTVCIVSKEFLKGTGPALMLHQHLGKINTFVGRVKYVTKTSQWLAQANSFPGAVQK